MNGAQAHGEVAVRYDSAKSTIELGNSWMELPRTRLDVSGTLGARLLVKASSSDMRDLLPFLPAADFQFDALKFDTAAFDGTVTGPLTNPKIAGHATARNPVYQGHQLDSLAGDIAVASDGATVRNGSATLGDLRALGSGSIGLANWKVGEGSSVAGSVDLRNADVVKLAALAGHKELPVTGMFSGNGVITGTVGGSYGYRRRDAGAGRHPRAAIRFDYG